MIMDGKYKNHTDRHTKVVYVISQRHSDPKLYSLPIKSGIADADKAHDEARTVVLKDENAKSLYKNFAAQDIIRFHNLWHPVSEKIGNWRPGDDVQDASFDGEVEVTFKEYLAPPRVLIYHIAELMDLNE